MVIQHNLPAMFGSRLLSVNQRNNAKATEHLSSGYRINRAADDAAGLSISEKMRSQIRGLDQAATNAQDGISLIQTAEGALNEVHSMIQRIRELSVQAANGTETDEDSSAIQDEINQLTEEIDRISETTEFNTLKLLDGRYGRNTSSSAVSSSEQATMTMGEALASIQDDEVGIFIQDISKYDTVQTKSGDSTTGSYSQAFVDKICDEIVPNAVNQLLEAYDNFGYLDGSSIGIGLNLYSDDSNTLAYVSAGYQTQNGTTTMSYTLSINMSAVQWDASTGEITNRAELESVIAHEMTHALMDEALTCGQLGLDSNGNTVNSYPDWFKEGVAQLASGPGNWLYNDQIKLTSSSSDTAIKNVLSLLGNNSNESSYASGYLACAYLGYLASDDKNNSNLAEVIKNGINNILGSLASGNSLDATINGLTNGQYKSTTYFENSVKNDTEAYDFVRNLLAQTGSGLGSIITGDLSATDIVKDDTVTNAKLFKVTSDASVVVNDYSNAQVTVLSGGTRSYGGVAPVDTYTHAYDYIEETGKGDHEVPQGYNGITFQIGANHGQTMRIYIEETSSYALGIDEIDVTTEDGADTSIDLCDAATKKLSSIRSTLGAYQNRLEHTINNLDNTQENLQTAESNIRDTDMADEMVAYTKNNILLQAGQSFLSQSIHQSDGIMQLLQ